MGRIGGRVKGVAVKDDEYKLSVRRCRISRLYAQGNTQAIIAKILDLDISTVSVELKYLNQFWLNNTKRDIDQGKADELLKINELEKMAHEEFEKSKLDGESTKVVTKKVLRKSLKSEGIPENIKSHVDKLVSAKRHRGRAIDTMLKETEELIPVEETTETVKRGQCGDPRYMQIIQWCIRERSKMLGLIREDNIVNQTNNHITFNFDTLYNNQEPVSDMIEDKLNEELRRVTVESTNG